MERKLKEYFFAGVRLVWFIDPATRTLTVYTAPDQPEVLPEEETLEGGEVLRGSRVPVKTFFSQLEPKKDKPNGKGENRHPS